MGGIRSLFPGLPTLKFKLNLNMPLNRIWYQVQGQDQGRTTQWIRISTATHLVARCRITCPYNLPASLSLAPDPVLLPISTCRAG
jgi:hypothetical protein